MVRALQRVLGGSMRYGRVAARDHGTDQPSIGDHVMGSPHFFTTTRQTARNAGDYEGAASGFLERTYVDRSGASSGLSTTYGILFFVGFLAVCRTVVFSSLIDSVSDVESRRALGEMAEGCDPLDNSAPRSSSSTRHRTARPSSAGCDPSSGDDGLFYSVTESGITQTSYQFFS